MELDVTLVLFPVDVDADGFREFCDVDDTEKETRADILSDVEDDTLDDDFRVPLTVEQTDRVVSKEVRGEFVRVNNDELVPPPFLIDAEVQTDVLGDNVNCCDKESEAVAVNDDTADIDTDSDLNVLGVKMADIEICITDGELIGDIDDDVDSERDAEEDGLNDPDFEKNTDCDDVGEPCGDIESLKLVELKAEIEASPSLLSGDALVVNEAKETLVLRDISILDEPLRDC